MNILMATMQLDIGGAETHIVELSKALSKKGIKITVASRGGAYEKELEDAGIRHIKVPLNSKNLKDMYSSYKILKNLIKNNNFDVIHAHARIPAFILGRLQKKLGFRLVTTAHWVFDTRFPLNLLTNWGERSLAVSDDIKKYLIDNYGIKDENIRVTINGIDMEKFSKDTDYQDIKAEFGLEDGKTRIVYCSRMDTDRSYAAHKLIEITPELNEKIENLEIIIVGGGNDFENIKSESDAINSRLGKRVIITTGSRTDINKFTASAVLFIGVSRAALEAMACEKPSIIAGNEGYIGIFDEDKLKVSIDTNFCCRGCEETTAEVLKRDVLSLLENKDEEKLAALGRFSRETVGKYYSVVTMAGDAIKMYISVIKGSKINSVSEEEFETIDEYLNSPYKNKSVMISGYYGFRNSGDDSILAGIVLELKKKCPGININVLSKNPDETASVYGVNSINRFNIPKIFYLLKKQDLFISGGGSLLQDMTSSKSLAYYLLIIKLAILRKVKTYIYANGIGPVNKEKNQKSVRKLLNKVDMITLRDKESVTELENMGITTPITLTADPVFTLCCEDEEKTEEFLLKYGIEKDEKYFIISIRPWKTEKENFISETAKFCNEVSRKYNLTPVILAMQPSMDTEISNALKNLLDVKYAYIDKTLHYSRLLGILKKAVFCSAMRLHTLIYAAKTGTPAIGISYDPKVLAMLDYTGQNLSCNVSEVSFVALITLADKIMSENESISKTLEEHSAKLTKLAEENATIAKNLMD